jgi:hypothetical protein
MEEESLEEEGETWDCEVEEPKWLKRIHIKGITSQHYLGRKYVGTADLDRGKNREETHAIIEELLCASQYLNLVSSLVHAYRKDLKKEIAEFNRFYDRTILNGYIVKNVAITVALGAVGYLGTRRFPLCRVGGTEEYERKKFAKGTVYKNAENFAKSLQVYDEEFLKLAKEEFEEGIFNGNLDKFQNHRHGTIAAYGAEGIAKHVLKSDSLVKLAAEDRVKTSLLKIIESASNHALVQNRREVEGRVDDRINYLLHNERELSKALSQEYLEHLAHNARKDVETLLKMGSKYFLLKTQC